MSNNGPYYEQGGYIAYGIGQGFGTSKGGFPQIAVKFKPVARCSIRFGLEGEEIEERSPLDAESYARTIWLIVKEDSDASMDFALLKLRGAGFDGASFRDLNLASQEFRVVCEHHEYEGVVREKWDFPLPNREGEPLETDDKVLRKLDSLFGRKLKAVATARPKPPLDQQTGDAQTGNDDIPF